MTFTEFLGVIDALLERSLVSFGFRRMGPGTWSRWRGDEFNAIWLQERSEGGSFCVNLGIHFAFLPKIGTGAAVGEDGIEQPECEIIRRLAAVATANDQWWPLTDHAASEVCELIRSRAFAIFDSYTLSEIAGIEARGIEEGKAGILSGLTKVRACLLLARVHEHLGNREQCIDAATRGIRVAGRAVGPKVALKDILKRWSQVSSGHDD